MCLLVLVSIRNRRHHFNYWWRDDNLSEELSCKRSRKMCVLRLCIYFCVALVSVFTLLESSKLLIVALVLILVLVILLILIIK